MPEKVLSSVKGEGVGFESRRARNFVHFRIWVVRDLNPKAVLRTARFTTLSAYLEERFASHDLMRYLFRREWSADELSAKGKGIFPIMYIFALVSLSPPQSWSTVWLSTPLLLYRTHNPRTTGNSTVYPLAYLIKFSSRNRLSVKNYFYFHLYN